ncbi:MAG: hypothetical protein J1F22_06495 [Lachnospiraceae bacterium]|nr:hypothetical protein [Lachnospiraceae bacterium]
MKDQKEFLQQMKELADFGRAKENVLTKEEIADYCSDLALTEKQLELVYAYLAEQRIQIPGFRMSSGDDSPKPNTEKAANQAEPTGKMSAEDSKYLRIYRKELRDLPDLSKEEMEKLYQRLRNGEEAVMETVINGHLSRVVTLAGKYRGRGVPLEDLIQEGNLELITCVSMLCGNESVIDFKKAIDHAVRSRLIELVDEELSQDENESTVLARLNLLLEATRTLAEEYGRIATLEELAEFTHMDAEEIQMYVDLTKEGIEIGKGEK